ncbi:MAG TPA: ABC transporter ATP-binding protein [Firmicutes bacterium]|jgi:ATP-binding cassette subfamily B multidrug efflux pump|nr:MAG: ABC transporter [Peptococcaceae bacterium 1109]HHT72818.1 ABC transporter ATP-binding protein [Bacillota bacterium]
MRHGPGRAGMQMQRAKDFRGTVRRLLTYLRPHRFAMLMVLVFAVISTVFNIFSPQLLGRATTILFQGVMEKAQGVPGAAIDFAALRTILAALAGLYIAGTLFVYLQQYIMTGVTQRIVYDLREDINLKLAKLPLRYYDRTPHGDTLSRITNDVDMVSQTLQQGVTQLVTSAVTVAGVVIMMLRISPVMTLVTMVMLPLSGLISVLVISRSQRFFAGQQRWLGELNGHVEEMFTGHPVVKAYGLEEASLGKFDQINGELYEHSWKAQFVSGTIMPLVNFVGNLGYVAISVLGGVFALRGQITIGDIQAFIQYSRWFTMPITQAANILNMLQAAVAAAERVFELLDEVEEPEDGKNAKALTQPKGRVEFSDVTFGYDPGKPILRGVDIKAKPGQTIAIVGPTGAGKTTLVNLLMRFYDVDAGEITVDGENITKITRGSLRRAFGMVLQDTWLFHGTIRDNIAYGRAGASEAEVVAAAKAAHAHHFIRTLPEGYDTILSEDGTNISQGQRQLLTIARAVLADPAILILDEATSSVDTRTELLIQRAMAELMKGRTSFVIAHRLSTIQGADTILVVNDGQIVEQGTHSQLLAKQGFYAELYYSQFSGETHSQAR